MVKRNRMHIRKVYFLKSQTHERGGTACVVGTG